MGPPKGSNKPIESQGHVLHDLNIALIVITTVIMILRLHARGWMIKAIGLDDLIAITAFGFVIALSALEIIAVHYGSGTPIDQLSNEQIIAFYSIIPINELISILSCGIVRLSILTFLPRLSRDRIYMRCIWGVGFVIVTITSIAFFFILTQCRPIIELFKAAKPNRNCISYKEHIHMIWAHSIVGVFIDLALFSLPIWIIRTKLTLSHNSLQVMLIFCISLFTIITGIIRLGFLVTTDFTTDSTYKMIRIGSWGTLESHVGLWCGCFPALQPLLRLISYKLGFRSRLESSNKTAPYTNNGPQQASAIDHERDGRIGQVTVSAGDSTTEFVMLEHVDQGIHIHTDTVVQVEEGTHVRERHEVKTAAWDAI
ncbi:hypothetical protein BGZ61DRAFT_501223 [Ilyonectria robusta]|uniref:uncharacterized protein n=1 Tax=Ilyonectria robusta TaxID=1079257 RepID=UPI001E8ED20B|nr:uncharacterized protein BGZ61DRAFT_501223 [Ilyonectria robusta]KAH8648236.1 hypothetical protein BGZ61DRAFT_501223 [Ilyonectria robusta]